MLQDREISEFQIAKVVLYILLRLAEEQYSQALGDARDLIACYCLQQRYGSLAF